MAAATNKIQVPDYQSRLVAISKHVEGVVEGAKLQVMDGEIPAIPVVSSGSLSLDRALGVGGYPLGRIVEVFGPYSSGKTTLTLHAIASAMKAGGLAAFIDAEHALDLNYAESLGVDVKKMLFAQPDYGEQALSIVDHILDNGMFKSGDIIVVDSVAALTPKSIIEGEMDKVTMGQQGAMMSKAMSKLKGKVSNAGVLLYFTNQIRDNMTQYGPATDTPGGHALKFYSSVRVETKRIGTTKAMVHGEEVSVSNQVQIKVVKNKVAPPFTQCQVTIRFGEGISKYDEILDIGEKFNVITKSGAYYKYCGANVGQGKEAAMRNLKADPKLTDEIYKLICQRTQTGEMDPLPAKTVIFTKPVVATAEEA